MAEDMTPRVWIGCLHCYNGGRLVGDWWDADEASDVTVKEVHAPYDQQPGCEELWCFDHENIPTDGELDPITAGEWGERFEEVGAHDWAAFMAYVRLGGHGGDIPTAEQFSDAYCGEFGDMRRFAQEFVTDVYGLDSVPDIIRDNVDWDAVAQDLEQDHTEEGGHIFRTI